MAEKSAGEAMADRREDEEEKDANPTTEEVSFKSLVNTFPASPYYVIPRWFYLVYCSQFRHTQTVVDPIGSFIRVG